MVVIIWCSPVILPGFCVALKQQNKPKIASEDICIFDTVSIAHMYSGKDIPLYKLSAWQRSGIHIIPYKIDILEQGGRSWRLHRNDYYVFILQMEGESCIIADDKPLILRGKTAFWCSPQYAHGFFYAYRQTGWCLFVEPFLIEDSLRHAFEREGQGPGVLPVPETTAYYTYECMQLLYQVLHDADYSLPATTTPVYLASACIGLFEAIFRDNTEKSKSKNRPAIITNTFHHALQKNKHQYKSPSEYACMMNLSLSYLNECVKATTGLSVSGWIHQDIIHEAKHLLYYTTLSIKEIAVQLGFEDPQYFSRLFIKITGTPPAKFRKVSA